jgi:hypothetical protein
MAAIVRTPLPVLKPAGEESDGHFQNLKASYASQAQALTKTEIIADDLEDVFGFCAAEIDGKPHIFYFTRAGEDEKGPPLMLWTGAGAAKVIGHFPKPKE